MKNLALFVALVVTSACHSISSWAADAPGPSTKAAPRIDAAIDSALKDQRIVGAVVLVSHDGKLVYQRAAGFADREARRPMQADALFRFSSVSKPVVSAAVVALVDQRKLSLDDPVSKWLPSFKPKLPNGEAPPITIRQLLTHTSGIGYKFDQKPGSAYHTAGVSDGLDDAKIGLDENLKRLASAPLFGPPGQAFRYGLSIDVLGAVIEKVTGKPLQEAVADLVTRPLGMRDTGFSTTDSARLAVAYYNAKPAPARMSDPQAIPFGEGGQLVYSPSRALDAKAYPSGGAGMVGTAPDVMRLLEAIRKGGAPIMSASSAASMTRNQIGKLTGPQPGIGFGFGGAVVVDPAAAQTPQSAGTWQWGGVYGHSWFVDPTRKITVVALTDTALEGMWGKFTTDLRDAVYAELAPREAGESR